ncbi:hypothetical protein TL16_g04416 [Triparma laevis f. inornata]|nr:hypothetical protein TL16_g04416 [Triparma laevis f. inornata]
MQTEWDSLMVETFNLKSALEETRRELSQALYQNDAAVRVIARLSMERDQARQMLAAGGNNTADASSMDVETTTNATTSSSTNSIPQVDLDVMVETWGQLSAGRKGRALPSDQATVDDVTGFKMSKSNTIHKASGKTGINCVATSPSNSDLIVTGGVDKQVIVFSREKGKMVATKTAGTKPVNSVAFLGEDVVSGSADGTVKIFSSTDSYSESGSLDLESPVVSVSSQPTGKYIIASTSSCAVSVLSVSSGLQKIATLTDPDTTSPYTTGAIHPDGLIFAAGTAGGSVKIWDLKKGQLAGSIDTGSHVKDLNFAENGYYLSAGCEDGYAHILDLRKMKSIAKSGGEEYGPITSVAFDGSVKMLAFLGEKKGGIVEVKKWNEVVKVIEGHKKGMEGWAWGEGSRWGVSVGLDRALKQWSM